MCGFCGFTGQIASPEEILESMKNKIIHRGPDSDGSHLDDGIAMGFRRLSFVDLEGGSQPIYNETRDMVITFIRQQPFANTTWTRQPACVTPISRSTLTK